MRAPGAAAAALAMALAACADGPSAVRFSQDDCRRVEVSDTRAGKSIVGIEDIAAPAGQGTLYFSAYDRLDAERAMSAGRAAGSGNIYSLPARTLMEPPARAQPLVETSRLYARTGFRPHGLDTDGHTIATINRVGTEAGFIGTVTEIALGRTDAARLPTPTQITLCAANDLVALEGGGLAVTLDRQGCPDWGLLERLGRPTGRVVRVGTDGQLKQIAQGLAFANGIARLPDNRLAVAETRGKRIRIIEMGGADVRRLPVPGAPDNINLAEDGRLIVALQPNLFAFARYRYGHRDTAASRIVAIDPQTGDTEWLYDGKGSQFSGATSAVLLEGAILVAGSVRDQGLLVCQAEEQS